MSTVKLTAAGKSYSFSTFSPLALLRARGKFSTVYKGVRDDDGTPVVIKQLNKSLNGQPAMVRQFMNELHCNTQHPNIIQTLGYSFTEGHHYLVREYVEGSDLKAVMRNKKFPADRIIRYLAQCLNGLEALHNRGIIHHDLRPANIIIRAQDDQAMITDLGLAGEKGKGAKKPFALIYSPPELVLQRHHLIDETSDIYSLALTFYEVLSRDQPFDNENPELLMHMQLSMPLTYNERIPQSIFEVLQKASVKFAFKRPPFMLPKQELDEALQAACRLRYQSAGEMKTALAAAVRALASASR
jgi:serine/threonine-protein kinase